MEVNVCVYHARFISACIANVDREWHYTFRTHRSGINKSFQIDCEPLVYLLQAVRWSARVPGGFDRLEQPRPRAALQAAMSSRPLPLPRPPTIILVVVSRIPKVYLNLLILSFVLKFVFLHLFWGFLKMENKF